MEKIKKERLRFTNDDDLCLLREVLCHNPFENNEKWSIIHKNVLTFSNKQFSIRTIKEHVEHLLKIWAKEDRTNLKKSGTEEEYGEKCQLLQDINDLCRDFKKPLKKSKNTKKIDQEKGCATRTNATKGMLSSTINPDCSEYIIFDYDVDERENVFTELNNITTTNNQEPQDTQEVTEQISNRPEEFNNEIPSTFMSQIFNNEIPSRSILQVEKNYEVPSVNKVRKRMNEPLKLSTLNFLEQKHVKEHETHLKKLTLEEKKLELEEKRIKLDTEKFEFDKKEKTDNFNLEKLVKEEQLFMEKREREERMILEKKEREERLKIEIQKVEIASQQQKILQLMLEQLIKKS